MEVAIDVAMESDMSKKLGCIIVDSVRGRVVAAAPNSLLGTATIDGSGRRVHMASMHSEMAAIEMLVGRLGLLQEIHRALMGRTCQRARKKKKKGHVLRPVCGSRVRQARGNVGQRKAMLRVYQVGESM